jgi:hypothetical protein
MASDCQKLSAVEFVRAACEGKIPGGLVHLFKSLETDLGRDLFCLANAIGALEPLSFTRPGAGELVQVYDKTIVVAAATLNADGTVKPRDGKLIQMCAPDGKVLVVKTLRAAPVDLTATLFGNIAMKRLAVMGFSEGFCPAGEPADGDDLGTFQNIEHVLLPPKAGFDVYARNNSVFGPATFSIHAEMWETC